MSTRFLSLKQVTEALTLSKATIYRRIAAGSFPTPVKLGAKRIAFIETEIDAWVARCATSNGRGK